MFGQVVELERLANLQKSWPLQQLSPLFEQLIDLFAPYLSHKLIPFFVKHSCQLQNDLTVKIQNIKQIFEAEIARFRINLIRQILIEIRSLFNQISFQNIINLITPIFYMSFIKTVDLLSNIQNIDFRNVKSHEAILNKNLSRHELKSICKKLKKQLKIEKQPQALNALNSLRKTLKSKYSIDISNQIIQKFIHVTGQQMTNKVSMNFDAINKEIKMSLEEISKKKYYINNSKSVDGSIMMMKPFAEQNGKRRKSLLKNNRKMPRIKQLNNLEEDIIKEKLSILKDYIGRDELDKFQKQINKKLHNIDAQKYGKCSNKIKTYTIYDSILQKIFTLIQEDTKNIQIRNKYRDLYKSMKKQMVAIITNQEEIIKAIQSVKKVKKRSFCDRSYAPKQILKKNYYLLEKDKQDLSTQIQQTIEAAKKHLKQAFIKRGRSDYAYDMELAMNNRKEPFVADQEQF